MGTGVALSQVQELIRENAALRLERDRLIAQLTALEHAEADAEEGHPADVAFSRWPIRLGSSDSPRNGARAG